MDIEKTVRLQYVADDKSFAMSTVLKGDGSTPVVQTMGFDAPTAYKDDGTPVYTTPDEQIKTAQKEFMAAAIAEQKSLCEENGVDPSLVNKVGAAKQTEEN
ncbi:hypothetical protein LRP_795 [Ligilactobacillus ruminis]|uniref:hypothetical protein n=1 Tax=Ligilactobacillus ruminis TaxID=1623 RepID=UPI00062CBC3C|nr:hypothetical protein [Ligilactobacillus ruminis]KLA45175.1 hypothetical protein LRP_795 [Ligilactobacillus ruminis]